MAKASLGSEAKRLVGARHKVVPVLEGKSVWVEFVGVRPVLRVKMQTSLVENIYGIYLNLTHCRNDHFHALGDGEVRIRDLVGLSAESRGARKGHVAKALRNHLKSWATASLDVKTNLFQIDHFFQIFLGDVAFFAKHTIQLLMNLFLFRIIRIAESLRSGRFGLLTARNKDISQKV